MTARIYGVSSFVVLEWTSGPSNGKKTQTMWQIQYAPVTKLLSWAWGADDGQPPTSYDRAMVEPNQQEFVFTACINNNDKSTCNFDH